MTVLSGGTDSNNLLTVSGGSNPVFNSATATDVRMLSGTATTAGAINGTVTLTTSGEGLTGESPINVLVPYTAQVTSGNAVWTSPPVLLGHASQLDRFGHHGACLAGHIRRLYQHRHGHLQRFRQCAHDQRGHQCQPGWAEF